MSIQMELHKIIISEMQPEQIIVLKEVDGERKFPIVIGSGEAYAIDRRLKGIVHPRPLTHDLLASVIESMGGSMWWRGVSGSEGVREGNAPGTMGSSCATHTPSSLATPVLAWQNPPSRLRNRGGMHTTLASMFESARATPQLRPLHHFSSPTSVTPRHLQIHSATSHSDCWNPPLMLCKVRCWGDNWLSSPKCVVDLVTS